jgi:hypothetical protein
MFDRLLKVGEFANIPVTFVAYIGGALWLKDRLASQGVGMNWQVALPTSVILLGLFALTLQFLSLRRMKLASALEVSDVVPATDVPHSTREIDVELFQKLVPVLERRYIHHENPPPGRPLPGTWLQEEVGHLQVELYRHLFDEAEIDILALPFSRETQTIKNAQELTEYHSLIAGAWIRTEQEFKKTIESLRTLATTWFSSHPENPEILTFLPGTQGNIRLTPEILANVQAQTKATIQKFRLYVVMLETLLSRVVLADPREIKKGSAVENVKITSSEAR